MAGSTLAVIGFYVRDTNITRKIGIFAHLLWLSYTVVTFNLGAMFQNTIMILAAILGLIRDYRFGRKHSKK